MGSSCETRCQPPSTSLIVFVGTSIEHVSQNLVEFAIKRVEPAIDQVKPAIGRLPLTLDRPNQTVDGFSQLSMLPCILLGVQMNLRSEINQEHYAHGSERSRQFGTQQPC